MLANPGTQLPHHPPIAIPDAALFSGAAVNPDTDCMIELPALLKGSEGHEWSIANVKEIVRLAQGVGTRILNGSNDIFFIPHHITHKHKKATYVQIVWADRLQKKKQKECAGWSVVTEYSMTVNLPTANLITMKCYINSTISMPGSKYCTMDITYFYLGTTMIEFEYIRVPLSMFPIEIQQQYQLTKIIHNNHVIVEVRRSLYGIP